MELVALLLYVACDVLARCRVLNAVLVAHCAFSQSHMLIHDPASRQGKWGEQRRWERGSRGGEKKGDRATDDRAQKGLERLLQSPATASSALARSAASRSPPSARHTPACAKMRHGGGQRGKCVSDARDSSAERRGYARAYMTATPRAENEALKTTLRSPEAFTVIMDTPY